jgi:hypothetical protein
LVSECLNSCNLKDKLMGLSQQAFRREKQFGTVAAQRTTQRSAQKATAPQDPGNIHWRTAGLVGLELTTYKGFPMTMPIVTARYSAITPSAARMQPEKKDTVITSEAQP